MLEVAHHPFGRFLPSWQMADGGLLELTLGSCQSLAADYGLEVGAQHLVGVELRAKIAGKRPRSFRINKKAVPRRSDPHGGPHPILRLETSVRPAVKNVVRDSAPSITDL